MSQPERLSHAQGGFASTQDPRWIPSVWSLGALGVALLLGLLAGFGGCARPGPAGERAREEPTPPSGVLGQLTLGPLPPAFDRLTALGRALGAWEADEDFFFPELRALAEALSDLGPHLDWSRGAHLLLLDERVLPGRYALALPVAAPEEALEALAERCHATRRGGAWRFSGGGAGLLPCRFHARAVPGGLVVAPAALLVDALARYGHALLDPRLQPVAQSSPGSALGPGAGSKAGAGARPEHGSVTVPLMELKAFVPALRARFGVDAKKVGQWVDLAAMGLAVASGDFGAAGELKEALGRLVAQLDSIDDVGLSLELGAGGVDLRLFATGRPGGALAQYTRLRRPRPLGLHSRVEREAAFSLALVGPGRTLAASQGGSDQSGHREAPGAGAASRAASRPALAPLVELLLPRLPEAFRLPARRIWDALTGPGSGELALGLRRDGEAGLGLELLLAHGRAPEARKELLEASVALLVALRDRLGGAAVFRVEPHRSAAVDRLEVVPGARSGVALGALSLLFGKALPSLAVSHRGDRVALVLGARAGGRALALLADEGALTPAASGRLPTGDAGRRPSQAPRASSAALPLPVAGTLGRVTLSLVELARLVPDLPVLEAKAASGALLLHWGVAPSLRRVQILVTLPAAHLRAAMPLLEALSDRAEGSAEALSEFLGGDEEPDDAL